MIEFKLKKNIEKSENTSQKRSEKLLCLDIKTKWDDPADEILRVVIDTELNFNNRGPKAEALVKLYSKLFDQKHYHVWRN